MKKQKIKSKRISLNALKTRGKPLFDPLLNAERLEGDQIHRTPSQKPLFERDHPPSVASLGL
jgi:hypothetical protein